MSTLHPGTAVPLYRQIYNSVSAKIKSGEYPQGTQIPSEDQLCKIYNVSRVTVRGAIEHLVEDGLLVKRRGKGTYVALSIFVETMAGGSFTKSCQQSGVTPCTSVLSVDLIAAGKNTYCLSSPMVWRIQRLRSINDSPVILEVDYFRGRDDYISKVDLSAQPLSKSILDNTGLVPKQFNDSFGIINADRRLCSLLQCPQGTPLLQVAQTVMTDDRQVLYYNEQHILTEKYKYVVDYK